MWDSIPSCLRRHKKKLLFFGGVIGGIAFFNSYLKRKFIEWESKRTSEIYDQLKRSSLFENTMIRCDKLFISFSRKIREVVIREVEVDAIVDELKQNPANKVLLWEQLKVLVFTQIIGKMYAHCLLCILLKVHMSILSGYMFSTRSTNTNETDQHLKYMSQIEDFMLSGISKLLVEVRKVCEQILKDYSLSKPLKLQDIKIIITLIQEDISLFESKVLPDISSVLMSPGPSKAANDNFLLEIASETKEILECEDFKKVLDVCVECGISSLMDEVSECYAFLSNRDEFTNLNDFATPLAKLIPIIHNLFSQREPSEEEALAHRLIQLEKLNNFAANIYEAFSQNS